MNKRWNILNKFNSQKDVVELILAARGISEVAEQQSILNPPELREYIKNLPEEFKNNLKKARVLIDEYRRSSTPILIFGDYDADGVCATAILYNTLVKELGYSKVYPFIPNRFKHGYGLSLSAIREAIEEIGSNIGKQNELLIITVDTGITAVDEVNYIRSLGYKVILTDHHQKPELVPQADVLLWSDEVVGSTISWILSLILGSKSTDNLALAGIATITDVHPLLGFNRTIVKESLRLLNTNPPLGIKKLAESACRNPQEITTYDLGWVIGPRLNASGRLVDAVDSLNILIEDNPAKLEKVVKHLNYLNEQRQNETVKMYDLASQFDADNLPKIIISHNENYHEGIIGLVASRLVQKYYRPAIVISVEGANSKGSVRSVQGIDIISVLRQFESMFTNLGGHPMAAGFSIETQKLPELKQNLVSYFESKISPDLLVPVLDIDLELPLDVLDLSLLNKLESLRPFGTGCPEPKFMSSHVKVAGVDYVGSAQKHVSFRFYDGASFYKGIMFNGAEHSILPNLSAGSSVDIVYKIKKNSYNGKVYVDLQLEDIRLS